MALEVLGVIVDQIEQVVHELPKGKAGTEAGDDRQQTWAAAGEYFQWANRLRRTALAGHLFPQDGALFSSERAQREYPKQVV